MYVYFVIFSLSLSLFVCIYLFPLLTRINYKSFIMRMALLKTEVCMKEQLAEIDSNKVNINFNFKAFQKAVLGR